MFMTFGWVEDARQPSAPVRCCHRCQRMRHRACWKETAWVLFFMVETIPLLSRTQVVCGACREASKPDAQRARQLGFAPELPRFVDLLEDPQFAGKSAMERGFPKAQRERRERID